MWKTGAGVKRLSSVMAGLMHAELSSDRAAETPSPLVGEGWGWGSGSCGTDVPHSSTPTPDPSPQRGGEQLPALLQLKLAARGLVSAVHALLFESCQEDVNAHARRGYDDGGPRTEDAAGGGKCCPTICCSMQ